VGNGLFVRAIMCILKRDLNCSEYEDDTRCERRTEVELFKNVWTTRRWGLSC